MSTEAAREMTPEELFDKAMGHRRTMLSLNPKPGDDVPMLSLMADQRAHRRANAKLDRLFDAAQTAADADAEFRRSCTIRHDNGRWQDGLNGAYLGAAISTIAWLFLWILLRD